ncbi:MAG: hypothetical protein IJ831_00630, partial [Spirochaetales bacterium]|nr:hypothetical protein [Spirochaetales bacterium]
MTDIENTSTSSKSQNGEKSNGTIVFQNAEGTALQDIGGTLVVTHNLTADNLRASIDIGGMPMPSLAVTHPDVKIDSFGEITLVGDSEMASSLMRNGEIFDRDMWSPVVPRPEYRIDRKAMQRFESWLEGLSSDPEFSFPGLASLMDYQKNNADSLASFYAGKDGVRLAYAREHGVDIDIPRRPARYSYDERIIKAALQWGKSNDARYLDYSDRTSFHNAISPAVEQVISDRLEVLERTSAEHPEDRKVLRRRKMIESLRDRLSPDNYSSLDHLLREAWSYREGATEIDTQSLYAILEEKAPRDAVAAWLREEKLKDVFRDPYLEVGRRRVPYDAQGIFEYMENSRLRANELGSLTYSNSLAASNGARALTSRKALSENEKFLGNTEDLYYNDAFENYHRLAIESYGSSNAWDALDNSNRAIGKYLSSDTRTRAYMKKQLSSFGFRATEGLVSEAMKLVDTVDSMTRRYFEAKPRRIMQLSDFSYAIVPESIDEASMEELENAGLRIVVSNNREQALSDIAGMDRSILFQEARRQEEEIRDKYRNTDIWMKALDGNDS